MGIFDFTKERKQIIVNGNKYYYNKYVYEYNNSYFYELQCPKYLHLTLKSRYKGVDICDNNHLSIIDENIIPTLISEIEKAKEIISLYHRGQTIDRVCYDAKYNLSIVFVCGGCYNDKSSVTYMVNHTTKEVSPIHGYMGHGREFAQKYNYKFKDLIKSY